MNTRNNLTDEWDKRTITDHNKDSLKNKEYGVLTNVISQKTFGMPIKEHQQIKGLKNKTSELI